MRRSRSANLPPLPSPIRPLICDFSTLREPLSKPVFSTALNGSEPALHHMRAVKTCLPRSLTRRARFQRSPGTLRLQKDQPFAVLVEVYQCEGGAQVIVVLLQAPE